MDFEAVVLDLDDTLVVEEETAKASMRKASMLVDQANPDDVFRALFESSREMWRNGPFHDRCVEFGISSWEGLWSTLEGNDASLDGLRDWVPTYQREAWRAGLHNLGINDAGLASTLAATYLESQRIGHRPFAGADAFVRSLIGRFRLGLLTNGPSDIQRLKLQCSGFADCFDVVAISGEVGVGKPGAGSIHAAPRPAVDRSLRGGDDRRQLGARHRRRTIGRDGCYLGQRWTECSRGATGGPRRHAGDGCSSFARLKAPARPGSGRAATTSGTEGRSSPT